VVTGLGREVRRRVGPSAWAVLEELVARGGEVAGQPAVVEVSTAQLAQALGLSADVTRSALRRLVAAGLVEREDLRSSGTSRFAGARYRIVGRTGLVPAVPIGCPALGEQAGEPVVAEPVADLPHPDGPQPDSPRPDPCSSKARRARTRPNPQPQLDFPGLTTVDDTADRKSVV
jgi:DNA-binding transcriptional ArsR family regulator